MFLAQLAAAGANGTRHRQQETLVGVLTAALGVVRPEAGPLTFRAARMSCRRKSVFSAMSSSRERAT